MSNLPAIDFPELQNALLDAATIQQLFIDLEAFAEIFCILPKWGDQQMVGEAQLDLAEAARLLNDGNLRGLQIRYRYEDAEWWDTILPLSGSFRLVRVKQEFR